MTSVRMWVDISFKKEVEKKYKQLKKEQEQNPKSKKKKITIAIATKELIKELKGLREKNKK